MEPVGPSYRVRVAGGINIEADRFSDLASERRAVGERYGGTVRKARGDSKPDSCGVFRVTVVATGWVKGRRCAAIIQLSYIRHLE